MAKFLEWVLWALKYLAASYAAGNFSRLNTPDTTADPLQYLLWVALPGLLVPAAALGQWLASPASDAAGASSTAKEESYKKTQAGMAKIIGDLVRDGHLAEAGKLVSSLEIIQPQRVVRSVGGGK